MLSSDYLGNNLLGNDLLGNDLGILIITLRPA